MVWGLDWETSGYQEGELVSMRNRRCLNLGVEVLWFMKFEVQKYTSEV